MALFKELRRRNVIKVAVLYVVASWLFLKLTGYAVAWLSLPAWTSRFVMLLLLVGFPVALIFAWVYEITPAGLRKEVDVDRTQSIVYKTGRKLNAAVAVLLVLGVAALLIDRLFPDAPRFGEAARPEPSVAVLPFHAGDGDGDARYLADGLPLALTDLLARVPGLDVAGSTSSLSLDAAPQPAAAGEALGVAHLLLGRVAATNGELRLEIRLVEAKTATELWSQGYDRDLERVFDIQESVLEGVVGELLPDLGQDTLPEVMRADTEVWRLYVDAMVSARRDGIEGLRSASVSLHKAVAIDHRYAPAWYEYGRVLRERSERGDLDPDDGYRRAKEAFLRALSLGDPRGLTTIGWIVMSAEQNARPAESYFRLAFDLARHDVRSVADLGEYCGLFARVDARLSYLLEAGRLDPLARGIAEALLAARIAAGKHDDAAQTLAALRERHGGEAAAWLAGELALRGGDAAAALAEYRRVADPALRDTGVAKAAHAAGDAEASERALKRLVDAAEEGAPVNRMIAAVHAHRGEPGAALDRLERARRSAEPGLVRLRLSRLADWSALAGDARWQALLAALGTSDALAPPEVCGAG